MATHLNLLQNIFVPAAAQWKEPLLYYLRVLLPYLEACVDHDEENVSWKGIFYYGQGYAGGANFCFLEALPHSAVLTSLSALPS